MTRAALRIDIVSDVVCPWCVIGYLGLRGALEEMAEEIEAEIHWRPFELNPAMPPEGQDSAAHALEKYGVAPRGSGGRRQQLTELGAALGFDFDFAPGNRIYNTFNAHLLIGWAGRTLGSDRQSELALALFKAYFQQHRNVGDAHVLADVAEQCGIGRGAAQACLTDVEEALITRSELDHWREQGFSGVPDFVLDGRYAITGGQDRETFALLLRRWIDRRDRPR